MQKKSILFSNFDLRIFEYQYLTGRILLHTEDNLNYYKIPYAEGTKLVARATASRCEEEGMKAVCPKPSGCYLNSDQCMVTPLADGQCEKYGFLDTLGQKICNTSHAPDCPALESLTVFRHGYPHGDAVIPANSDNYLHTEVNGGNPIIAGTEENTYYAYCVECNSCQGKGRRQKQPLGEGGLHEIHSP